MNMKMLLPLMVLQLKISSLILVMKCIELAQGSSLYPRESTSREIKSLDGIWKFRTSPSLEPNLGFDLKWYENVTMWNSDLAVRDMPVPSSYNDISTESNLRDFVGWVWYYRKGVTRNFRNEHLEYGNGHLKPYNNPGGISRYRGTFANI